MPGTRQRVPGRDGEVGCLLQREASRPARNMMQSKEDRAESAYWSIHSGFDDGVTGLLPLEMSSATLLFTLEKNRIYVIFVVEVGLVKLPWASKASCNPSMWPFPTRPRLGAGIVQLGFQKQKEQQPKGTGYALVHSDSSLVGQELMAGGFILSCSEPVFGLGSGVWGGTELFFNLFHPVK